MQLRRNVAAIAATGLMVALLRASVSGETPADASGTPVPETRPKPVETAPSRAVRKPKALIRFQYEGAPYSVVIRRFAQIAGKPLIGEMPDIGELTFYDSRLYTYEEALDTLNLLLSMRGYQVREVGRFLRVMPLRDVPQETPILRDPSEAAKHRPGEIVTAVIALKFIDAETAANAVVRMVSSWGSISRLPEGKAIIITDLLSRIQRIREFLKLLDKETQGKQELKTVKLEHGSAATVAGVIRSLYSARARRSVYDPSTRRYVQVAPDPSETVTVMPDAQSNTIMLLGAPGNLAMAEQIIERLDSPAGEAADFRTFVLKKAKADDLAKTVQAAALAAVRAAPGQPQTAAQQPRVISDAGTNRLIVSASPEIMGKIEKLILELDDATVTDGGAKIFRLKHGDAQQLRAAILTAMTQRDARGRTTTPVTVGADPRTNTLLVGGAAADVATAGRLVEALDVPSDEEIEPIQMIRIASADADALAAQLQAMLPPAQRGKPAEVLIAADALTNSVLLRAPQAQRKMLEDIIAKLDAATEQEARETRIIPLEHTSAASLAAVISRLYASSRAPGRVVRRPGVKTPIPVGGAENVVVAAAPNDRALIVDAPRSKVEQIASMVAALDVDPGAAETIQVRTYQLEKSDAREIARALTVLFAQQAAPQRGKPPAAAELKPRFQADSGTNQLLVAATEAQFEVIDALLERLTTAVRPASETVIFRLQHARAEEIVAVLESILTGARPAGRSSGKPTRSPATAAVSVHGEIRLAAMAAANAVVVQAPPEQIALARELIESFDVPGIGEASVVIVELKNATAESVAEALRSMLPAPPRGKEPDVFVHADSLTNSVLLRAPAGQRKVLEDMIARLDEKTEQQSREVRIIRLKNASASALAMMLQQLYQVTPQPARRATPAKPGQKPVPRRTTPTPTPPAEKIIITAAPGDRALVVEAPRNKIDEIAALVAELDTEKGPGLLQVRTYQLETSDAAALARSMAKLFAQQARPRGTQQPAVQEPQPRFEADSGTNQLLVAATVTQFETIEKLIRKVTEGSTVAIQTETFKLTYARATEVATVLEAILAGAGGRGRRPSPAASEGMVRVAAMAGANSVVVQGPPAKLELAGQLIAKFDVPEADGASVIKVIELKNASADAVAEKLKRMVPSVARGQTQNVFIEADTLTNSVLLRAPADQRKMLEELIAVLDKATREQAREVRLIRLKHSSAASMAMMLRQLYPTEEPRQRRSYYWWSPPEPEKKAAADRVVITPAPDDRTLVVEAPPKKIDEIEALVAKLDSEEGPGRMEVRTYQLANAAVEDVARSLTRLFREQRRGRTDVAVMEPRFEANSTTNQLMIAATMAQFPEIEKLIERLQKSPTLAGQTRTFKLEYARAEDVAEILQVMLTESSRGGGRWGRQTTSGAVRVAAMPDANAVVVQGPPDKIALAAELIDNFDNEKSSSRSTIQIVRLTNAQCQTLADAMNASIARRAAGRGAADVVTVTAEPNSNSVLVRGPARDVPEVVEMIQKLDGESTPVDVQVRVFKLENSEAAQLAESLSEMFRDILRQQPSGRGTRTPPFSVTADERTNSLVVTTTAAHFALVEEILKAVDKGEKVATQVQYVRLQNADADTVSLQLQMMFHSRRLADRPVIEADWYSNAITIIAKEADWKEIQQVIARLDEAARDTSTSIRVVTLKGRTSAARLAEAIQRIYSQTSDSKVIVTEGLPAERREGEPGKALFAPAERQGRGGSAETEAVGPTTQPTTQPAKTGDPKGAAADGEGVLKALARPNVTIAVDTKTNSLIISATQRDLDNIEDLIAQLTTVEDMGDTIRVFKIKQADPVSVAETLNRLFNPQRQAAARQPAQQRGQQEERGRRPQPAPAPAPQQVITAVADPRTRSVIVRASEAHFEIIEPLINQLDLVSEVISEVRVFTLKNTLATEVAANLRELFKIAAAPAARQPAPARGRRAASTPTQVRAAELTRQLIELKGKEGTTLVDTATQVSISANAQTNSVIVAAPAEAMKLVASLIEELDQSAVATRAAVRMYPLKHAEVRPTVEALQAIFTGKAARPAGRSEAAEQPVAIAADEAARLVIVSGPPDKHELIARTIGEIDNAQASDEVTVQVYRILHADAAGVAKAIQDAMGAGAARGGAGAAARAAAVRISHDPSSNSIVVRASREDHARVAEIIAQMDTPPVTAMPTFVIALNNADAEQAAQVLRGVFGTGAATPRGRAAAQGAKGVVIEPDRSSRLLVVRADAETFEKIKALAMRLDAASPGVLATQTIIALKHAQAGTVAAALSQAFAPKRGQSVSPDDLVTVVAEPFSNSVIVTANEKNLEAVQALLAKLDTETAGGSRTEMILLKHAKATDLASVLSAVAGEPAGRRGAGGAQTVVVSAEPGSNALVLSGPAGRIDKLMRMAIQLDQATESITPGVYIIALTNGEAGDVAAMVQNLYRQQVQAARREKKSIDPLAVTADERANAVVLATTKEMYERVAQWINEVESMTPPRGRVRLIPLEHADPAEVQKAIEQLFGGSSSSPGRSPAPRGRSSSTGRPHSGGGRATVSGKVETTVLEKQRAIMVTASEEDFEAVAELVRALDKAASETKKEAQVFIVRNATNKTVASALDSMYRAMAAASRDPKDQVSITAPAKTNALIVSAAREKMQEIRHLIEQLDKKEVAPRLEFRIYPLANAQPTKILPALRSMLSQITKLRPDETIDVQADERTRSIIVTARGPVFDQIGQIIKTLDEAKPINVRSDVLIIPLKHADATRLAEVLNEMLRPSEAGQVTPEALALQEQIRLLRVRSTLKDEVPELDLTKPIKISADPRQTGQQGSNALIVSSTPDNLKALRAIVEILDTVPIVEGVKVKIVHLKNADAVSVMAVLKDIFTQGLKLAGKPGTSVEGKAVPESVTGAALTHPFNVSADMRTNTLVLAGLEESLVLAELIVRDLDRIEGKITTEVRLFQPKHVDATKLAPMLSAVFAEGAAVPEAEGLRTQVTRLKTVLDKAREKPERVSRLPRAREALTVQADAVANVLIVAARSDVMPLIADVIETMDVAGAKASHTVEIFPLANADAQRIQEVVTALFTGPNAKLVREADRPAVTIDTRTNALVVAGSQDAFSIIKALLRRLDAKGAIEVRDIRLLRLDNADAASLAETIQKIMDQRVQRQAALGVKDAEALRVIIVPDPRTNILIVGGSVESFDLVKSLVEELDAAPPALSSQVQLFPLKEANAGAIAPSLTELFNQRHQQAVATDPRRLRPIILPDMRTNALLVVANKDDTAILKGLLVKLDVKLVDPALRLVVIPLDQNDATVVGQTIQSIFAARLESMTLPGATPSPQDKVNVETDALSNALIISASKENLALIRGLLDKLDKQPAIRRGLVRMYHLKYANAERVAEMLRTLVQQGLYKPGGAAVRETPALAEREKVAIAVDPRTNVLFVSGSEENLDVLEDIIRRVDADRRFAALSEMQAFPLKHADAEKLAPTLQQLVNARRSQDQQISVVADPRSNSVLVAGTKQDFAEIERLLQRLDIDAVTKVTEIRVFPLRNADAEELAAILTDALTTQPKAPAPASPNAQTLLQFIRRTEEGRLLTATALQEGVLVVPNTRTNSLVVLASKESMTLLESLITSLDLEDPRVAEIRVFMLQNADARSMADILKELFRLEGTAPSAGTKAVRYTLKAPGAEGKASATLGTAEQYALTITVDPRTNSLLCGGTEQYTRLVGNVIQELDSCPAQERITRIYRLRNARANDIQTALRTFLDQERERITSTLGQDKLSAAQRLLEHEVAVVAVAAEGEIENSNTLLLSASPRYFQTVEKMIEELDQPPPQVLIQVLLAEVSLNEEEQFGFDWQFDTTSGETRIRAGTSFGVSAAFNAPGIFSVAVTGGDLSFFFRALQSEGRAQVLSRPQILASDNQEAEIRVVKDVPYVATSTIVNENIENRIEYQQAGIILTVKPRINPDGFVRLEVSPEVSTIDPSTVPVTETVNAFIFNRRVARTTVTVQDGHTVVLGGLITTTDNTIEQKVPLLGDIPLIGWLFKDIERTKERSELLIILTPRVVWNVEGADAMSRRQIKRLKLLGEMKKDPLQEAVLEMLRERQEEGGQKDGKKPPETQPSAATQAADETMPLERLLKLYEEAKARREARQKARKDGGVEKGQTR
jgi:type II secretory pathway component GspD/PulD (secretin)